MPDLFNRITDPSCGAVRYRHPQPESRVPVFFDWKFIPDDSNLQALWADETESPKLRPGCSYQIRVYADFDGPAGQGIFISSPVQLFLKCQDHSIKISQPTDIIFDPASTDRFFCEFYISIESECPRKALGFELLYKRLDIEHNPKPAGVIFKAVLEGTYNPVDPGIQKTFKVGFLDKQPPDDTAFLHIQIPATGKFRLWGWSLREKPLQCVIDQPESPISLAHFVEGSVNPADIKRSLRNYFRRAPTDLLKWLQKLIQNNRILVVVDETDAGFPWELTEIADNQYIGALIKIVRWIPVQYYIDFILLNIQDKHHRGAVIAYLDNALGEERDTLNTLSTEYCQTPAELLDRLKQPLHHVGMVYLGCHGMFTYSSKHEIAIGTLHNPENGITCITFEDIDSHEHSRPIFFLNACHSARLMADGRGLFGLPEVLLARVAGGFIGTTGPVGSAYAAHIANYILHHALITPGGIQIAEALRQLREDAVEKLRNEATEENLLRFVYTFMYVYFGNPRARLSLIPAEANGEHL